MPVRPPDRRRTTPLVVAGAAGLLLGWLARSWHRLGRNPVLGRGGRVPVGSAQDRRPTPFPPPVPMPEGAVDAPYTAEEPYTGQPRYGPDVPGGPPP
ncbi:hypothetical protein [Micromonospora cathayae]|uniref:Uncharacterized protein n=1 Tax=Micromonospora cathayae TaxID=3028804 RepID=A0ABY7ZU00_9ACTN|nr:hypothetical protein [Micromonospora sp. HUAS 3]WDZ85617.1 hypothetical protein PVK37_03970 [Micromonospora sp. HUAS 3]